MSFELVFLFFAGFFGGVLNSIAGGGSFITFPALIFVGIPPIMANASNTFASCAGYMSGTYAFRKEISAHKDQLPLIITISLIGGILGAWLLLKTPEVLFREAIPWLLLFASVLFIFGGKINATLKKMAANHQHASSIGGLLLIIILLGVATYGGFFNAGLGIITLSYLALAGHTNINTMNGLKLLVSSTVSLIAIAVFIFNDLIAWYEGTIVLCGTLAGGYIAAHVSRQLPQEKVRYFVIIASIITTLYFFFDSYAN
ncbi:sulfite exporter TauE/SafE family protein [Colwellia hornerae]|uniref:Probable membrane transporter protein n=1 Tax=Colwellia hornerae TaxID=89402 RepID=A0A5C6QRU9_9GAMM|nr:sulfite exporter TauE/SafE family protein [Colwellia hornerae]TWX57708.1 sulfite exporter TauE/SafE family protein [Colwellia hornerae]TWX62561.1 sulfite exporter TauE/SafE family protein [Colwellia hornerae]TWX71473.1 sulfite exporter TauE/SafE family protein [Colwellia hornerae]